MTLEEKKYNRRPIKSVSFADLKEIGIDVYVTEFEKTKPDGSIATAVKVVRVTKTTQEGKVIDVNKDFMENLLYTLGIDTYDPSLRWWVSPKKHHRTLSHGPSIVYDYRYQGYERIDEVWKKSGRASEEAIMYDSKMSDMDDVIYKMKRGGDE